MVFFSILAGAWSDAIGALLAEFQTPIHLLSAAVMVWFGLTVIAKRSSAEPTVNRLDLLAAYGSTLLLALCNPMTILPYLATASGFVVRVPFYSRGSILIPLGVVLGATSWYVVLSSAALLFRRQVSGISAARLNLVAGTMLIGLGGGIVARWLSFGPLCAAPRAATTGRLAIVVSRPTRPHRASAASHFDADCTVSTGIVAIDHGECAVGDRWLVDPPVDKPEMNPTIF